MGNLAMSRGGPAAAGETKTQTHSAPKLSDARNPVKLKLPSAESLAKTLGGRAHGSYWMARCPAHDDREASLSISDGGDKPLFKCHAGCPQDAVIDALRKAGHWPERRTAAGSGKSMAKIVATYDYVDEAGELLFQAVRYQPKDFKQRQPDGKGGWSWKLKGVRQVPYRLPAVKAAIDAEEMVFIVEGEKDADNLARIGLTATCNAGGAGKWKAEHAAFLKGASVVILPDNDEPGRNHAEAVAASLDGLASRIRVLELPGLPAKGDVSDWLKAGGNRDALRLLAAAAPKWKSSAALQGPDDGPDSPSDKADSCELQREAFLAYMLQHKYIFVMTGELWPAVSVNSRVPPIDTGKLDKNGEPIFIKASEWLDRHQPVEQMTWAPNEPQLIGGKLIHEGGWIECLGVRIFNLYRRPTIAPGDPDKARPWLDHVHKVYGDHAEHLISWFAHRVQRPGEKINHALVLGGAPGIGKDTILEPVKHAIGPWNFAEVSPQQLLGRFNGFVKSVILRVSEARDLGEVNRFAFYDHCKTLAAAPPDVLRCDEKNLREHAVPNVTGMIITTNYKADGLYLPADDRRHFVAWSDQTRDNFDVAYWDGIYEWYAGGGFGHVAACLAVRDLSKFNPKAPPSKTDAFWEIVDANRAPEESELGAVLATMEVAGKDEPGPLAVTLDQIVAAARGLNPELADWLKDRRNRRLIPGQMESAGYVQVRNQHEGEGRWKVSGKHQKIYALKGLPLRLHIEAAQKIAAGGNPNDLVRGVRGVRDPASPDSGTKAQKNSNDGDDGAESEDAKSRTPRTSRTDVAEDENSQIKSEVAGSEINDDVPAPEFVDYQDMF